MAGKSIAYKAAISWWPLIVVALLGFARLLIADTAFAADNPARPALIQAHLDDFDGMAKRRVVRILVPYSKTIYFIDRGRAFGTAVDFGLALEKSLNLGKKTQVERIHVLFVPTRRDRLFPMLNKGLGDIVMANLTVTPSREEQVDFTAPLYGAAREVLVASTGVPEVTSVEALSGREVAVRKTSSYYEHLLRLNDTLTAAGKPPVTLRIMDESLEDEDLMEMVNADLLPATIVDEYKANIWQSVFPAMVVRSDIAVSTDGKIAWAIRKNSPQLMQVLNAFVETHKVGSTFGNILRNTYYKSDKVLKRAYSPDDAERFKVLLDIFRRYGDKYSFDYLMLAAQSYQESQLDQQRRSPRGAVGLMQLLPSTAKAKPIEITGIETDPEHNVEAGAKYLRYIMETYLTDPAIDPVQRQLMAFAAYNAGPANLRAFRRKATDLGLDPNVWFGNVENGAAAIVGRETVQYVSNIYKYYVAYTLLSARLGEHDKAIGVEDGG